MKIKELVSIMKKIFLFLFLPLILKSQKIVSDKKECPPCEIIYNDNNIKEKLDKWPEFSPGDLLKINSLTKIQYERYTDSEFLYYQDNFLAKGFPKLYYKIIPWWKKKGLDPWSNKPYWGENYEQPKHNFKNHINDNLRWICGYSYVVEIPKEYHNKKKYPLIIFLHGTTESLNQNLFWHREYIRKEFYKHNKDPYIYTAPIKLDVDWSPNKIKDLIDNIKENLSIDDDRIYLTGLSMGGRGSFIVAAKLKNTFASLFVVAPHHGPYEYISLAKELKDLPILITHGDIDETSSFKIAKKMADTLISLGSKKIIFKRRENIGHTSWYKPFRDSVNIKWMMSWKK